MPQESVDASTTPMESTAPNYTRHASTPQLPGAYPNTDQPTALGAGSFSVAEIIPQFAQDAIVSVGQAAVAYLPTSVAAYIPESLNPTPQTSLPRQELGVAKPHEHTSGTSGVGAPPGSRDEQGVAHLPMEKDVDQFPATQNASDGHTNHTVNTSGVGVTDTDEGPIMTDSGHLNPEPPQDIPAVPNTSNSSTNGKAHDHSHGQRGSRSHGGGTVKVSLKDRIRGEAKVVLGKLGNKEEKVEEGRRILSGSET